MTGYATFPSIDFSNAETLFEPPGDGEGNWAGAPCVHRHQGRTYLAVRFRSPDRRGYAVRFYERTAAGDFDACGHITANDLDGVSVERAALCSNPRTGALQLYLPVEHGENEWTIQKLTDAERPADFDPATAEDVLVPAAGTTDEETVKDPVVLTIGRRYVMFYAGHDGTSEQAHLATSIDGETWTRSPTNPVLGRAGWHDHHTRISSVVPAPDAPVWLVTYDGSGLADYGKTWNLRTGVATATELETLVDSTPESPAVSSPVASGSTDLDGFGTCRYVAVLVEGGEIEVYAEVARSDGAFELRRAVAPWPAGI